MTELVPPVRVQPKVNAPEVVARKYPLNFPTINTVLGVATNELCSDVATADEVYLSDENPIGDAEPAKPGVAVNEVGPPVCTTQRVDTQ